MISPEDADALVDEHLERIDDAVELFTVQEAIDIWEAIASGAAARLAGLRDDLRRSR